MLRAIRRALINARCKPNRVRGARGRSGLTTIETPVGAARWQKSKVSVGRRTGPRLEGGVAARSGHHHALWQRPALQQLVAALAPVVGAAGGIGEHQPFVAAEATHRAIRAGANRDALAARQRDPACQLQRRQGFIGCRAQRRLGAMARKPGRGQRQQHGADGHCHQQFGKRETPHAHAVRLSPRDRRGGGGFLARSGQLLFAAVALAQAPPASPRMRAPTPE